MRFLLKAVSFLFLSMTILLSIVASFQKVAMAEESGLSRGELGSLTGAIKDLCDKDIALLGEASHGDGKAIAFKSALVENLVKKCGYSAVFFEASHYDFVEFSRRIRVGKNVTREMISSSIGEIWNHDSEIQPLIEFLFQNARTGRIKLGGLDDQLGSRGAFYSLQEMPRELVSYLDDPRRSECFEKFRRRIWWDYPPSAKHSQADQNEMQQCLSEIKAAVQSQKDGDTARVEEILELIANMERCISRDFFTIEKLIPERDHSMFLNLEWIAAHLHPMAKIIVWS